MIASLTTMGLISNQAFAGPGPPIVLPPVPPQIGDFRCYFTSGELPVNQQVILTDQFFPQGTTHTLGSINKICANVQKNPPLGLDDTPTIPNTHYRVYPLDRTGAAPQVPISLTDQFGTTFTTVGAPRELWVPAVKTDPAGTSFPLSPIHWKCYDFPPQPIVQNPVLVDQFLSGSRQIMDPAQICTPVLKEHNQVVFGTLDFPDHLKCYRNFIGTSSTPILGFLFADQFTDFLTQNTGVTLTQETQVCLVAGKGIDILVSGTPIPIDTTMVLLGATQTTASWMIPAIIAAIGIGIVIARKF